MNCTSKTTEAANGNNAAPTPTPQSQLSTQNFSDWLPGEIRSRHLPLESHARPSEVIPLVHKFLKRHLELEVAEGYESHKTWKATLVDWNQFLQKLESEIAVKKLPEIQKQPLPTRPESCQKLPDVAAPLPKPCQPLPPKGQTVPNADTKPAAAPTPPSDNFKSQISNFKSSQNSSHGSPLGKSTSENPQSTTTQNPQSEPPKSSAPDAKSDEPPRSELESADYDDGFATERERLAVARSELQDHLALRPIRLNKLTAAQQAAIFALLTESNFSARAVSKILAEPTPPGMGIRISKTALNNWRRKYEKRLEVQASQRKAEADKQAALQILDKTPNPDAAFQTAAERILKLRILTSADAPDEKLDQLVGTLTKLRKQSLAERKQHHAEKSK